MVTKSFLSTKSPCIRSWQVVRVVKRKSKEYSKARQKYKTVLAWRLKNERAILLETYNYQQDVMNYNRCQGKKIAAKWIIFVSYLRMLLDGSMGTVRSSKRFCFCCIWNWNVHFWISQLVIGPGQMSLLPAVFVFLIRSRFDKIYCKSVAKIVRFFCYYFEKKKNIIMMNSNTTMLIIH